MIAIDIETSCGSQEQLALVKPDFSPAKNLRDPEKIKADLLDKEQAWLERAALSPLTGQVLAIGTLNGTTPQIWAESEPAMLANVWRLWNEGNRFVGFNVKDFDFKFLKIRSHILGVPVPADLMVGRYWSPRITCLQEVFCAYSRDVGGYSLNAICLACNIGRKSGNGADFGRLFKEDREAALSYIAQDLLLTAALAKRLGVA